MAPTVIAHAPPAASVPAAERRYPLFNNPDNYLRVRQKGGLRGWLKRRREERALDRCLAGAPSIRSVCDVPAGPGRLFAYWKRRGWRVDAFDLSENMVARAAQVHRDLGLEGQVHLGNAFAINGGLTVKPDLVASIRFGYYFDHEERVALWRSLAAISGRYVLVHFKVGGTLGTALRTRRARAESEHPPRRNSRRVLTPEEIASEVAEAGLRLVRFQRASRFSLASYALAERVD